MKIYIYILYSLKELGKLKNSSIKFSSTYVNKKLYYRDYLKSQNLMSCYLLRGMRLWCFYVST